MAKAQEKSAIKETWKVQAKSGFVAPCFYRGQIIRISDSVPTELYVSEISYETKILLQRAIKSGHLILVEEK